MSAKKTDKAVNEELQKGGLEGQLDRLQKPLTYFGTALIVIVLGIYGYREFIQKPNAEKAIDAIFMAQEYFEEGDYNKALDGDNENYGFLDVISKFGGTNQGNLARYYAGVSYLQLGAEADSSGVRNKEYYNEAVKHLKKFSTSSQLLEPLGYGRLGDAYSELGEYNKAVEQYDKAVKASDNALTAPDFLFKLGIACLETQQYDKAAKAFKRIKDDFPESNKGAIVDSYQAMAEAQAGK